MIGKYTIPEWFPKALIEHVRPHLEYDQKNGKVYAFERLITYPAMKDVWQTLQKKARCDQQLHDFLIFSGNHSSLQGDPNEGIAGLSDKQQHKAYVSLQKDFESIIRTLKKLGEVNQDDVNDGWNVVENASCRSKITLIKSKAIAQPKEKAQLSFDLNRIKNETDIKDILESMSFAVISASHAEESNLPKRRQTKRAKANSFSLALSEFFKYQFNCYLDELVAITTNVAFDFKNDDITSDAVSKLRNPTQPKSRISPLK